MKLSIIIPVFNEEKTISQVLKKVLALKMSGIEKEIIIVDDGSTDATVSTINKQQSTHSTSSGQANSNRKILRHQKNLGKGAAVRTGIQYATGDYILIQDADLEYNPRDIPRLLKPILQGESEVVYGTRLKRLPNLSRDERTFRFLMHYFGNRLLSVITSLLYGQWITDMETGYKLLPRKALSDIKLSARSFDFEPEITAKILKKGLAILEVPITTNPRGYDEGKKLSTFKDGTIALWTLLKYRLID